MNGFIYAVLLLFYALPTIAQRIYVYPTAAVAVRGSYQSVTAVITGVSNKTVTWTTDGGKIVGTNPCAVNEPCTVALYSTTAGTYHLTATSNANNSISATSTITIANSPAPTTTHPRLYIAQSMLSGLRAKAVSKNTMYGALRGPGNGDSGIDYYNQLSTGGSFNGIAYNWSWSCKGGTGLPTGGKATPNYLASLANQFALLALIDPSDPTYHWGCYGHDVWMYVINAFNAGTYTPGQDEWRNYSGSFGLTTDWLLGSGAISSPGDVATARTFVAKALKYSFTSYILSWFPSPSASNYNSLAESPSVWAMRNMGNNYNEARFFLLATLPLTFNDNTTDDPPLANTCGATRYQICPDWTAGSMHAYFQYFDGAILYDTYAHMEDPTVSWPAYETAYANLPTTPTCLNWQGGSEVGTGQVPCFGDGRGGESSEGNGYGFSVGSIRSALNAIYTAGYADPIVYGPQMSLETSSWWDLHNVATSEFLTGLQKNNGGASGRSPAYGVINTGDENSYQTYPNNMGTNSATMVFDTYTGRTDRMSSLEWPVLNTAYGGPAGTLLGCVDYCGFTKDMYVQIANGVAADFFISLPAGDPVATPPADPRPSMPYDLWNGSYNQHQMVRTGFTPADTLMSITCGNTLINHEHGTCGRIEIYSGNEWITKGRNSFNDYNAQMNSAPQSNELAVVAGRNDCGTPSTDPNWYWACMQGGTWGGGQQAGYVLPLHSELPGYAANIANMTKLYNQWQVPTDITSASRSTIFLKATKQVVFYDRADTPGAQDKAVYMNTTGAPTITGNVASWPTRSGTQKVYLTTLLPSAAAPANIGLTPGNSEQAADWEVATTLKVDGGSTASNQFLHVLEWGASSFTKSTTTLVQSSAGQNFDGALVGNSLVMFMRNWPGRFTGTTFPASGATTIYLSDLTPNTSYVVTGAGAPANCTTDTAGVCVFDTAGTGSIIIKGDGSLATTTRSATLLIAQYKVPIWISFAAASLLLIGQTVHRGAAPQQSEGNAQ